MLKKTSHHFYFRKIMFQIMYNFEELRDDHIVHWSALRLPLELARFRSKAEKECLKKILSKI